MAIPAPNCMARRVAHDGAHALPLGLLQPDEARALLSRALGTDRVDDNEHAVAELIRLCGSLPLALRVAAARLAGDPALRTADLVAEMTEGNKLEALEPDGDTNSPLRTAFSVSYRVLAPGARRLFRLLGLFPGADFTAEARTHAEQALALARTHSFRVVKGQSLTALCETAEAEEAHGTAVELGQEALAVHRGTGHRLGEARTLTALARVRRRTDGAAAELMRRQAWTIFSDIGVPKTEYENLDR
ncbi:hypothetical protein [Streptomyces sp. SID12501]|uniref:hypothetical protein n=1 Tax=Streptomyces sp. SID12501 TaxID=2706042 RepID=UPI00194459B0|nr:hypothetical protein [Streptomyces sp. SID12501]